MARFGILLGAVLLGAGSASACELMTVDQKQVVASSEFEVRGYNYWSDQSLITISWEDGAVAETAVPDGGGEFSTIVSAPAQPGTYRLVAQQAREDSAPVVATVTVVAEEDMAASLRTH